MSPSDSIRDVLQVIDDGGQRIAIVVDGETLLGVVTDGDIRRGMIKGVSLDSKASQVMNSEPMVGLASWPKSLLLQNMNSKDSFALPLVDENNKLCGVSFYDDLLTKYDNPVFIMAGGFGTRLKPLTDNCPKPLLKVGKRPILETVLQNFIQQGFHNFYISTHYLAEKIEAYFGSGEKWGVSIKYVYEECPLGTGGALGLLPDDISTLPLLMINGDILTSLSFEKLLHYHNEEGAEATMCVREYAYQVPYGVITHEGNRISSMLEKPVQHFHVNAGVYVVDSSIVKSVKSNCYIDMPTLLEQQMKRGKDIIMYPVHEYWLDIGRMDDFERAQSDIYKLGIV